MQTLCATWTAQPDIPSTATILPDGCRDVICLERPGAVALWFVSPLQLGAKSVPLRAGQRLTGFRLAAGTAISPALLNQLAGHRPETATPRALIAECTRRHANTGEALDCLAQAATVQEAARDLGVSMRSLQKMLRRATGQSPAFWLQLARTRRAARLIPTLPLADAACMAGFADQAHMSRAFRRWFGVTPSAFRARPDLVAQVFSRAYG